MTTKELARRISFRFAGYGHYKVELLYRNKYYYATTTNTMAIDRIVDGVDYKSGVLYNTLKSAYYALYDEVIIKNNLK